ncbi:MAG: hypothetical protein IIC71_08965 [Acidobacteria bacterium]|nr:hypothetical protein [Acidobacteriota bacterium]
MASLISEAELIVIPETGHVPTLIRAKAVTEGIMQLLQQIAHTHSTTSGERCNTTDEVYP